MNDEIPKHRSSKDTKRWCKGKVGREHDYVWVAYRPFERPSFDASIQECSKCHKLLWKTWVRGHMPLKKKP